MELFVESNDDGSNSMPEFMDVSSECIIHYVEEPSNNKRVTLKDLTSWQTLLNAAKIRKNQAILNIANITPKTKVPEQVYYHRYCRSRFTLKRDLEAIKASNELSSQSDEQPGPSSSGVCQTRRLSGLQPLLQSSRVYEPVCIFCEKTSKYKKGSNEREPLIKCGELRVDETVRNRAFETNDSRILAILSRELVAAEGHYHRACYRNYTRPSNERVLSSKPNIDMEYQLYTDAENKAYAELFTEIRDMFREPKVTKLSELRESMKSYMRGNGISELKASTRTHMLRKIKTEFKESLNYSKDSRNNVLIYPDNLTIEELVKENQDLKYAIRDLLSKDVNDEGDAVNVALKLRKSVQNHEKEEPWPPLPSDLKDASDYIPDDLLDFCNVLLSGKNDKEGTSEKVTRVCESIGQDIVYSVTCGRRKPPKHILLPFAVKSLTGNVELVKILNRLGHGISNNQLEEVDTALCLDKLRRFEDTVPIPECIHPNVPTTLAWDNIDRLEETLSGKGTSHRVNGIAVQKKTYGPFLPSASAHPVEKRVSFTPTLPSIPEYNAGERAGPISRKYIAINETEIKEECDKKNILWALTRLHCSSNQTVSSWTGFNILTRDDVEIQQDNIGYMPTINSPATQLKTVHEVLKQSAQVMQSLELPNVVVVFDQALYAKATDILWKRTDIFKGVVPRMGVFHTICTLLSIIGKRFADAGLKDLYIESGVVAEGSVAGVLEGRKYNRAIRVHKLMYEGLIRLAWKGFYASCVVEDESLKEKVYELGLKIDEMSDDICAETFSETVNTSEFSEVATQFHQYLQTLRNKDLASFWMTYIDMVALMLNMLRASREGNWKLHLQTTHDLIPWCFAYDNINYARYLSAYFAEMSNLPKEHPSVHEYMQQGGFSVQIGSSNPFGRIPVDQTIEETVNKDTQTQGGTKGFSLNPGAVSRYYLTAEYRTSYLRQLKESVNICDPNSRHADLGESRIRKDEADVQNLMDMLENNWLDPFNSQYQDLVSISTGTLATPDVQTDLQDAEAIGRTAYEEFRKDRLEPEHLKKFHDPIKKRKLKTFCSLNKKKIVKISSQNTILKADRNLFAHMIIIAQTRNLNMEKVLRHPLGPIPWALAAADGTLRKTSKSALINSIIKNVKPAENLGGNKACIIDGMALLQKVDGNHMTFAILSKYVLSRVMGESRDCRRVDVVFDVYKDNSIKDAERVQRGSAESTQFKNIAPGHSVQQWRQFLKGSENKKNLIKFLVNDWKQPHHCDTISPKQLYVTCEDQCFVINENICEEVEELKSTQEEADTRLLLHVVHASTHGLSAVVLVSEDTDVTVICLANISVIGCQLYQKKGTQTRTVYIDIGKLGRSLGQDVCEALPGLHAFTGCDTVNAFAGRGKLAAFKHMKAVPRFQEMFKVLGTDWQLSDELFERLQEFTCTLYSPRATTTDVNELRYRLFCAKKGEIESWQLPPCAASLHKHCMRANYQCAIWRRCLEPCPDVPSPVGNGWQISNHDDDNRSGSLAVEWNDVPTAPDAVMELLMCSCSRDCKLETCPCLKYKLRCTQMCRLKTCSNQREDEEVYISDKDNNDYDDDGDDTDDDSDFN